MICRLVAEACKNPDVDMLSAQGTLTLGLEPVFYALGVEVVVRAAIQRCHLANGTEFLQADRTVFLT